MVLTDPLLSLPSLFVGLRFGRVESYWLFYTTIAWLLAWGAYGAVAWHRRDDPRFQPWRWPRVAGLALVLWPFVQLAQGVVEDFGRVLDPNSVAGTVPEWAWWRAVRRRSVQYVLMPLVGMFLALGLHERIGADLRERLRHLMRETGVAPRRSLARDLANGSWLFVVLYLGYWALAVLLSPLERLDNGDESAVFAALTPSLAIALALTAGITEELLFRGILQTRLQRIMPVWGAILIQSVFFGLIHSGYGTIGHIVFPALFGVAMGLVVLWFGLVPAIMVHAGVDLVIFLVIAADNGHAWTLPLVPFVFLAAIVVPAVYFLIVVLDRMRREGSGASGDESRP